MRRRSLLNARGSIAFDIADIRKLKEIVILQAPRAM
jgi:hypothetical protein